VCRVAEEDRYYCRRTCSLEHEEEDQAGHGNRDRDALASRPRSKHEQYQGTVARTRSGTTLCQGRYA